MFKQTNNKNQLPLIQPSSSICTSTHTRAQIMYWSIVRPVAACVHIKGIWKFIVRFVCVRVHVLFISVLLLALVFSLFARSIIGWMECVNKKSWICCGCSCYYVVERKWKRRGNTWQGLIRIFDRLCVCFYVLCPVIRLLDYWICMNVCKQVCTPFACLWLDWLAVPANTWRFKHSTRLLCGTDYIAYKAAAAAAAVATAECNRVHTERSI